MIYKIQFKIFALLFIITVTHSGCKVYYDINSINSKLKSSVDNVNQNCSSVTTKIGAMQTDYLALNCKTDAKPFQIAKQLLSETDVLVNEMAAYQKNINDEYGNFKQYTNGKSKIESGTPEWKKFKVTKKTLKANVHTLQSTGNDAVKKATAFNKYANEELLKGIQFCDVAIFNFKFDEIIINLDKSYKTFLDQLTEYDSKLQVMTEKFSQVFPDQCKLLNEDFEKIKSGKEQFESVKANVQLSVNKFKVASAGKQKIYSCSSEWAMVSQAEKELTAHQSDLSNLQQTIQGLINHMQTVINTMQQ